MTLTPYARVEYVNGKIDAFQETGGLEPLRIESQRYKSTVVSLGGQAQYAISASWGIFVPFARIEYNHVAQTNARSINAQIVGLPSSSALLPTLGTDKNYGNVGLGASAVLPDGISGYFNYEHVFGKEGFTGNRYTLGIRIDF